MIQLRRSLAVDTKREIGLNKVVAPLLCVFVLTVCAPSLALAFSPGENLLTVFPKGYTIAFTDAKKGVSQIMELVPEGQTVENWKRMITVQTFYQLKNMEPSRFGDQMAAGFQKACPRIQVTKLTQQNINDRPTARFLFYNPDCGARPAESVLLLILQGQDALHVVQYAWRPSPPVEREIQEAKSFLDRTRLCDTRKGDCEAQMQRLGEEGKRARG